MQGRKAFEEKLFTHFQLSDRVPADNFYRKLKETLDLQFLYKTTAPYYGTEGQESIDPVVFFKLILIGYLENLASDRRIINTAVSSWRTAPTSFYWLLQSPLRLKRLLLSSRFGLQPSTPRIVGGLWAKF